jgi:hypothetical protein
MQPTTSHAISSSSILALRFSSMSALQNTTVFISDFAANVVYEYLISPTYTTFPIHHIFLDLITLIIIFKECNFIYEAAETFEVLTALTVKVTVFWNITPCSLIA